MPTGPQSSRLCVFIIALLLVGSCGRRADVEPDQTPDVQATSEEPQAVVTDADQAFTDPARQAELALLETKIMVAPGGRYTIAGEDADETALRAHLRQRARINRHATLTLHIPESVRATDATRIFDLIETYRLTNVQVTRSP